MNRQPRKTRRIPPGPFAGALFFLVGVVLAAAALGQTPPCNPCAGILTADPLTVAAQLAAEPALDPEVLFWVAFEARLDGSVDAAMAQRIAATGAVPWLRLMFSTPPPLSGHLDQLEAELEEASRIARQAGTPAHFQVVWAPPGDLTEELPILDYAFLLKRAAVALTGAQVEAQVVSQPLLPDPEQLRKLFAEDVAAYLEAIALVPATDDANRRAIDLLMELDPGTPIIADSMPYPDPASALLPMAARRAVEGFAVSLFDATMQPAPDLLPLKLLAREFQGDVAYDPYSTPAASTGTSAWTFVRGADLGLRVIVEADRALQELTLTFSDSQLRNPERIDLASGEVLSMFGGLRDREGYSLRWQPAEPIALLRLERPGAEEIEGISGLEEEVTVTSERQLPVEEILRRLQAVEDSQNRRLRTYRGVNTTHLRFQFGSEGIEITFEGEIFYRQGVGYDWAWQRFHINGLRWKGREFPKIPLIEPERAASLPLEILFRPDYRYNLRGTDTIDGRDCWVVDFRPLATDEDSNLFRGTVWIDRELYVRVRSRAVQIGLEGEVISNEETISYSPVDLQGQPAEWIAGSFWLPLRVISNQIWSIFNGSLVVEKEVVLGDLDLNDPEFESRRQELLASRYTMVRDTEQGMRYLVPDKQTGQRVVLEKLSSNRFFLAGGVFYDPSLDYPLPLVGFDYLSLDFLDKGSQLNVFFGGVLLTGSYADPSFLGSRFDAGIDLFAIGISGSDTVYRDDLEIPAEEVKQLPASMAFNLGHPLGQFGKLALTYRLGYTDYSAGDDTAEDFVLPVDHYTHTLRLGGSYSRFGYRFRLDGSYNRRSDWQLWGLPDSDAYSSDQSDYLRWQASLAKTFHFRGFRTAGIELLYVDGQDLDRFSKYQLGFFSDIRVRGYESNRIRAERAFASTLSYGVELGELFRLQGLLDTAWISDQASGLEQELAAGIGVAGTVVGPWKTILRLDLGKAIAGPDDGTSAFLAFLKLW